ncbi:MAG: chromate transporter [Kiritimatiellae bacterium]|nr:chromate transporter [Kiritimatiellia bacterium]
MKTVHAPAKKSPGSPASPASPTLGRLFWRMFAISAFVLGGGFAIIAVADEVFSKKLKWTEEGEITGQLPVFQMVPGMICTNTAIYVGNKVAGPLGAAVALAGTVLPSLVIFTVVTVCYGAIPADNPYLSAAFSGLRAALAGVIAALVARGWSKNVRGLYGYAAVVVATALLGWWKVPAAPVVLGAAVAGIALEALRRSGGACRRSRLFCPAFLALPLLFLKYGSLAFGGGYVLVPMYMADFVGPAAPHLNLSPEEFANVMALTQMTPGSISVNCATFFGYRMCGTLGSVVATVAMVLPNYVLLLLVLRSLDKFKSSTVVSGLLAGIRPATTALMAVAAFAFAGMSVWTRTEGGGGGVAFHPLGALIFAAVLTAMLARRASVVALVFWSAAVGALGEAVSILFG